MSRGRAAVLGAGGHAKVVIATLQAAGWEVASAWDDAEERHGSRILGVPVRGAIAEAAGVTEAAEAGVNGYVIGIGDNRDRRRIAGGSAEGLDLPWISAVHPRATVHPSVALGEGTVVFAGAVIQPDTVVGRHAVVNTGASIDHDCRLGDFVHVAPGCRLGGGVSVGGGALVGIGSVVLPGATVGAWATVGAGAVVIRSVADGETTVGAPARPVRREPS